MLILDCGFHLLKYNNYKDCTAITTRIIAGAIAQIVSIICRSRINCLVKLFWMILIMIYIIVVIIIIIVIKA
jgi:hypothetical protein